MTNLSKPYPGLFVTLEGPEGCGKTCQLRPLVEYLESLGLNVFPTREPGGTEIGEAIRDILHNPKNTEMDIRTETLLYQAARSQFVEQVLRPHLAEGEIVISDRYSDSTVAYQGYGRRQDINTIRRLIEYATDGFAPDLTILLDVDTARGLERKGKQGEWNRMDAQPLEFHRRIREGYLEMIKMEPERWRVVDANRSEKEVFESLTATIENEFVKLGLLEGRKRSSERF